MRHERSGRSRSGYEDEEERRLTPSELLSETPQEYRHPVTLSPALAGWSGRLPRSGCDRRRNREKYGGGALDDEG